MNIRVSALPYTSLRIHILYAMHAMLCSAVYCDVNNTCISGSCSGPNKCTCNPGWIGDQCELG